jgi:Calx-beta domain
MSFSCNFMWGIDMNRYTQVFACAALALFAGGCADMGENSEPAHDNNHGGSQAMSLTIRDTTALEGVGLVFRISRTGSTADSVSVSYATSNGMAFDGEDYTAGSGVAVIDSGALSTIVTITTLADTVLEDGESFTLTISSPSHDSATIADAVAFGQIWDDDGVRYSTQVRPLVLRDCALSGCHGGGSVQGGVNLGTGQWSDVRTATHLGEFIVVPKDAAGSHMYDVIQTGFMPDGRAPWTPQEIKLLEDWINQDAQNN